MSIKKKIEKIEKNVTNNKLIFGLSGAFVAAALGLYLFSYFIVLTPKEREGLFNFGEVNHEKIEHPKKVKWSFDGMFGTFDKASAQRGYQVYKEVCSSCHSMNLVAFRNLQELGFTEPEVKVLASSSDYDFVNDDGDVESRPGLPSDHFKNPYPNKQAAAAANNGKAPPDLSLMAKARHDGPNYIYSILTGYTDAPAGFELSAGANYNPYFPGMQIAMAKPLSDAQVSYEDGTKPTVEQMSHDIVNFLQWTAEPEMEYRKRMGIKALAYLAFLTVFFYIAKVRIWSRVK